MQNSPPSPRSLNPPSSRKRRLLDAGRTAERSRRDPNTFIPLCFTDPSGLRLRQAGVHRELQAFLGQNARGLIELPRDHGKSVQVCGRIIWELGHNPALRVKIICATEAIAAERARFIRDAITGNPLIQKVFPNLKPAGPWTANAFTLERPAHVMGPTVAAYGSGGGNTGTRADLLVCDDVVDVRALHSRVDRSRVADYFENNLMNLLEPEGRFWGLFTPWHADDLNARLKKNAAFALFRRPIGPDFEPIWPAKWPRDRLLARRDEIGTASFARGYCLQPVSEEDTPIRAAWVRFWTEPAACEQVILSVDPAVSTATRADRSALVVLGYLSGPGSAGNTPALSGPGPRLRVLAARAAKVSAPQLVALIDVFDRVWNPAVILFESNAAFLGMKELLARQARFGPKLKGVTQTADKLARVSAFSVAIENGAFQLRGKAVGDGVDETQRELFEEMVSFPFADHDDLLDAAATGCAYLLDRREPRVW